MNCRRVTNNICIENIAEFGNEPCIMDELLAQVQLIFSQWVGDCVLNSCQCIVGYKEECPTIYDIEKFGHLIRLHVKPDDIGRIVYQFAHEYCHHIISGRMSGEISGLKWFEETLCELASYCQLETIGHWYQALNRNDISVSCNLFLLANKPSPIEKCYQYVKCHLDQLSEACYHRDIYSKIASSVMPLFERNTHLWKLLKKYGRYNKMGISG